MKTISLGIVGLPNVGKSTLFKALTRQEVHIANYPFATIDPNMGVVPVPDPRLQKLSALSKSKKTIPAVVEFYDIAGIVRGAHEGEGLGNQFLTHIRDTQAIVIVIRLFSNVDIIHVEHTVDPLRDLEILNAELILKDLETIEKRLEKTESESKSGSKDAIALRDGLLVLRRHLHAGNLLTTLGERHSNILQNVGMSEMKLLTAKKQIYLLNGHEKDLPPELPLRIAELGGDFLTMDLSSDVDLAPLIQKAYGILGLMSFFTTGEDETRAWTIVRGALAPDAAGEIHSDFEQKFIRAEVVSYTDLIACGGWQMAKQKGKVRIEGKDYVVQDGDVIVVRHGA